MPAWPEHFEIEFIRLILVLLFILKFLSDRISNAIVYKEFPASIAVDSPNFL